MGGGGRGLQFYRGKHLTKTKNIMIYGIIYVYVILTYLFGSFFKTTLMTQSYNVVSDFFS